MKYIFVAKLRFIEWKEYHTKKNQNEEMDKLLNQTISYIDTTKRSSQRRPNLIWLANGFE